jgi:hypothetical protein
MTPPEYASADRRSGLEYHRLLTLLKQVCGRSESHRTRTDNCDWKFFA